jgi:hypothetical protein
MSEPVETSPEDANPGFLKRVAKFLRMSREEKVQTTAEALPESIMPNEALALRKKRMADLDEQTSAKNN